MNISYLHIKLIFNLTIWGFLVTSGIGPVRAQTDPVIRCGTTMEYHERRMQIDPAYARHVRNQKKRVKELLEGRNPDCSGGPVIIPVAVHFDAGVVPSGQEACAIDLVVDQLNSLYLEFNGEDPQNSAYEPLQACFPGSPSIGDACLSFCLASYNHPPGYGLAEGQPAVTFGQIDFSQTSGSGSSVPFDPEWAGYLNIFVGDLAGGLLGQAAGIPGAFSGEGVVIDACTFGTGNIDCPGMSSSANCGGIYGEGNTLTHEVGHYLGLYHIWGDNSYCSGVQDYIADTPNMNSNYSGYTNCSDVVCTDLPESCSSKDMYMNYMSYAGDVCMYLFTSDQADVMHATALASGFTGDLPVTCSLPETPVAGFNYVPDPALICPSPGEIQFIDQSTGPPTSWYWSFSGVGVSPESSTQKNPVVSVSNGGELTVSLVAENVSGTSQVFEQVIQVTLLDAEDPVCDICSYSLDLFDSFGDGWNGASLEIWLNGIQAGMVTLNSGSYGSESFTVIQDQTIELLFNGGTYDSEISFDLIDPYGYILHHEGVNPPDGTVYSATVSCLEPTCEDGIQNGNETGVDCGGEACEACPVCQSFFYDSGGPDGSYSNNENVSQTLCPDQAGEAITLHFTDFDVEYEANCGYDFLKVYNGHPGGHLIGTYCGTFNPPDLYSTAANGCLYLEFYSDAYVRGDGWVATVACGSPCNLVTETSGTGPGTLADAINCAYPGDTIRFAETLSGQLIVAGAGTLILAKDVTLLDPDQSVSISVPAGQILFQIQSGAEVRMEGLTITGNPGVSSPLIQNNGKLILQSMNLIDESGTSGTPTLINQGILEIGEMVEID